MIPKNGQFLFIYRLSQKVCRVQFPNIWTRDWAIVRNTYLYVVIFDGHINSVTSPGSGFWWLGARRFATCFVQSYKVF
jgi:hypothetical protein